MKEHLVPQEQSLQLKELGFDKKCWGVWVNGRFEPRYKSKNSTFNPNQKLDKRNVDYCTAPTFEQAFDWFRVEYKLLGTFGVTNFETPYSEETFGWSIVNNDRNVKDKYIAQKRLIKSYEEARLECLKKLIEQSKN